MPLRGKALPELGENWLTIEQMVGRPSLKQADALFSVRSWPIGPHRRLTSSQCVEWLGFRHLAVLVASVTDLLSVDRPDSQRVIFERD
jgi:hypothetical protein